MTDRMAKSPVGRASPWCPWSPAAEAPAAASTNRSARPARAFFVSRSSRKEPAAVFPWSSSRRSTRFAMSPTATASWPLTSPASSIARSFSRSRSHGYEVDKDGFGYRGKALEVTEGGSADIVIRRLNIARRLYRVTGAGIYRDSVLTGDAVPIREPLLNGKVFGQDSVVNAVYQGKIHWFWGDTNRPDYPLGNFHVPGATSDLPGQGGLEPEVGVNLSYFLDDQGFARPTAADARRRPDLDLGIGRPQGSTGARANVRGLRQDPQDARSLRARLVEFNPQTQRFEKVAQFPEASAYAGEFPDGHPFLYQDQGVEYIYYATPYPLVRVPADPEHLKNVESCEAYTCLQAGHPAVAAAIRPRCRRPLALRLEDQHAAPAAGSANQADRLAADQARGGAAEPARHRLGQGRGGARRLGLLECVPPALGDDQRRVVRQHVAPGRGLVRRGRYAAGPLGLRPQDRDPRQVQLLQSQAAPDVRQGRRADHLLRGDLHHDVLG